MRDLSLHVLDLAQNSIVAHAKRIEIGLQVDAAQDLLTLVIADDGDGMSESFARQVLSPFATTRSTRRVGLGLPMMQERARQAGGDLTIETALGKGTRVTVTLKLSHIDRPPLGDLAGTLLSLLLMAPEGVDYTVTLAGIGEAFALDTAQVRAVLEDVPLSDPDAAMWLRESLEEAVAPYHAIDSTGYIEMGGNP